MRKGSTKRQTACWLPCVTEDRPDDADCRRPAREDRPRRIPGCPGDLPGRAEPRGMHGPAPHMARTTHDGTGCGGTGSSASGRRAVRRERSSSLQLKPDYTSPNAIACDSVIG